MHGSDQWKYLSAGQGRRFNQTALRIQRLFVNECDRHRPSQSIGFKSETDKVDLGDQSLAAQKLTSTFGGPPFACGHDIKQQQA